MNMEDESRGDDYNQLMQLANNEFLNDVALIEGYGQYYPPDEMERPPQLVRVH